jgi:ABC-type uncharacterized transport system involved in gliding motility auxiliary subunit
MTEQKQSEHHGDVVKDKRELRFDSYLGILFVVIIFFALNFIGFKNFVRHNFSSSDYTQLSALTKNMLANLEQEVEITNFSAVSADMVSGVILEDVGRLLQEYEYASKGKVKVKKIDPYIDYEEARQVANELKLGTDENVLVIQSGEQSKVINYRDLADVDTSQAMYGGPVRVTAFKGEQVISSALQSMVQGDQVSVYFLTGHNELDPQSTDQTPEGLSLLASYIERQNAKVLKLNLVEEGSVPEDAALLVIAGPKTRYSAAELEILENYLQRTEGLVPRLMIMLDSGTDTGLEKLLDDYGVVFNDDLAVTRIRLLGQVRVLVEGIATKFGEHPAVDWLVKGGSPNFSFGRTRSIEVSEPDGEARPEVTVLAETPDAYWGETDLKTEEANFDENTDTQGPLNLAVAIDTGSVSGGQVKLRGAKIVAVGGAEFMANRALTPPSVDFFVNGMNWLLEREEALGIAPKVPQEFSVKLTDGQKTGLFYLLFFFPVAAAVASFLIWLGRRK